MELKGRVYELFSGKCICVGSDSSPVSLVTWKEKYSMCAGDSDVVNASWGGTILT